MLTAGSCRPGHVRSIQARALQQHIERDDFERPLVGRLETHGRHDACLERPFPWLDAYAPPIAGLQSGKAELRARRNEVVPDGRLVAQEFVVDHDTHGMTPDVLRPAVTFSVTIETRQRVGTAGLQGSA